MSSKWMSDGEEVSDGGDKSPQTPNSPPSEPKEGGGKRRRPRVGRGHTSVDDSQNEDIERPAVKSITGGWGLDGAGSISYDTQTKSGVSTLETAGEKPTASIGRGRKNHFDNEEAEILVIPDLEDDVEEDMVSRVATAPKNATRRVPTLRELDEDLKFSLPSTADGLDMSLLTKTLVPPDMLEEDDNPWGFDTLLQAVTQEFNVVKRMSGSRKEGSGDVRLPVVQTSPIKSSRSTRSSRASIT